MSADKGSNHNSDLWVLPILISSRLSINSLTLIAYIERGLLYG